MGSLRLGHFERAIADIYAHGDNDTLPFDVDNRFIAECGEKLSKAAFKFSQELALNSKQGARNVVDELQVFFGAFARTCRAYRIYNNHKDTSFLEFLFQRAWDYRCRNS